MDSRRDFMENKVSNKTIRCNSCDAEFSEGTSFCTECGKPIENVSKISETIPDQNVVCPQCNAEISSELKFCEECGTKIEHIPTSNQETTCPKCFAVIPPGTTFCTECGENIQQSITLSTCPKCYAEIANGEKFCIICGTSLEVDKTDSNSNSSDNQTLNSAIKSGKGLMNGLGGFLNKATSEIDKNLNQSGKSTNTSSKNIDKMLRKRRENEKTAPGFLVCDKCDGYYELQPDESPNDFSGECECGGRLKHQQNVPY